jgi:hypothetical protein
MTVAARAWRDRRRFGDNKPAAGCALVVILEHQITRNAASRLGAQPAQGRHHDTMAERQPPDLHGREQLLVKRGGHAVILTRFPTRHRRRRRSIQALLLRA